MFNFNLDNVVNWVCSRGFSSVAIQLPEGLKSRAADISDFVSKRTGVDVWLVGQSCYGACDIFDYREFADALIHFGHSPIPSQGNDPNIMYVETRYNMDISTDAGNNIQIYAKILPTKVGIVTTVQYLGLVPKLKSILESLGKTVFVGSGDNRVCYPGQILGCNCSSAESIRDSVDSFIFVGEGRFHPLTVAFSIDKTVYTLDPTTGIIEDISIICNRILRKRFAMIQLAKEANAFFIIVCSKKGQNRESYADYVIRLIHKHGKNAYKIIVDEVNST